MSDTKETTESVEPKIHKHLEVKEREVTSKFVSDGVYKYVYVDTGEDVK